MSTPLTDFQPCTYTNIGLLDSLKKGLQWGSVHSTHVFFKVFNVIRCGYLLYIY